MIDNVPRVIGAILLALAAFLIYMGSTSALFFVLAGVILIFTKKKSSKQNYALFRRSFSASIFYCSLVEALNLLGFFGILLGVSKFLERSAAIAMESTDISAVGTAVKDNIVAAQAFFTSLLISVIVAALVFFILYTVTRYFIWRLMGYKRPFWKFVLMSLVWWIIWLPIMALVFIGVRPEIAPYIFAIVMFLYIYITFFVQYSYFNKQKVVGYSLQSAFSNKYIVPLAYAFALFVIAAQALRINLAAGAIVLVVWLCWARSYFNIIAKKR